MPVTLQIVQNTHSVLAMIGESNIEGIYIVRNIRGNVGVLEETANGAQHRFRRVAINHADPLVKLFRCCQDLCNRRLTGVVGVEVEGEDDMIFITQPVIPHNH